MLNHEEAKRGVVAVREGRGFVVEVAGGMETRVSLSLPRTAGESPSFPALPSLSLKSALNVCLVNWEDANRDRSAATRWN